MSKKAIQTLNAPKAIGPYSQAIRSGDLLFISGQLPIDPGTGGLVPGGIEEQVIQVLKNLNGIMKEAGFSAGDVVKVTVFLKDLKDFDAMNRLYADFFIAPFPARATFEVSGLPKGALVEIEAIASK